MENQMLCYQCSCAKDGKYCNDTVGTCGKSAETSRLQDELTGALIGLAKASVNKSVDEDIQRLMVEGLAATAAHTDFDNEKLMELTKTAKVAKTKFVPKFGNLNASLKVPDDFDIRMIWQKSPDIRSLKSLLLFGIRGIALYANESRALGMKNREATGFFHKALIALGANHFKEDYYDLLKEMGGIALRTMEQANKARTTAFGQPAPVDVPRVIDPGPFIVVSGHNFEILGQILEQTKDSGIPIYSHGEMLSAHAYPEFRKYRHFKGHYGTAWQNQQSEFDHIPAAVIFTSGCMALPLPSYIDRVFTAGTAHIGGVPHLGQDFTPALIRSIELGGAPETITFPGVNGGISIKTGFGKKSVRTISYKLAAAYTEGNLHHIYVLGGCDGMEENRRNYTDIIRRIPTDAVVLTWGCTKYRFNDIDFGTIDGVPRIIDLGMCGNLPLVIETIEAIAESAKLRVDELPLTWHFTWQESRSTAAVFALLAADIQNVILGPALPPFFTEEVFRTVTKDYGMTLRESKDTADTGEYAPVYSVAKENTEASKQESADSPLSEQPKPKTFSPEELEVRSEAAGLPVWAISDDEEESEDTNDAESTIQPEETSLPKVRPEDLDQSPAWLSAEDEDDENIAIEEAPPMDIEARAEAAGLPAWAMEDPEDEEDGKIEDTDDIPEEDAPTERTADFSEILALRKEKGESDEEYEDENEFITEPADNENTNTTPTKKDILIEETAANHLPDSNAPKIVIPKGKGVSGWKDPDEEPSFVPGERKPYRYTPPKELVEIPQPPPIALPAGAGVSGFAANHDNDTSSDNILKNDSSGDLYTFAEAQAPIKIPKGKGVSGWKESDDEIKPIKSKEQKSNNEKPWLKQSMERLHAEVEKAKTPQASIPAEATTETPQPPTSTEITSTTTEEIDSTASGTEEHSDKPWLAASIKQLKESIAADEAAEAEQHSDKPWLAASLKELHAEVEAEKNGGTPSEEVKDIESSEEPYVSKYKHNPQAAADKPWLKASIEELKNSIDAEAGIKSVRNNRKEAEKAPSPEEVSDRWQDIAAPKSWKDITPTAPSGGSASMTNTASNAATPLQGNGNTVAPQDEPGDVAEPDELWHKPERTPKPWDQNLTTTWQKPVVLPKPWENPNATSYHTSADERGIPKEQIIPNIPLGSPTMQQQIATQQAQQQAITEQQAQQAAYEAQQRALAEQQAAYEAQQQAIAQQIAYEAQQRALSEQKKQQMQQQEQQQAQLRAQQQAQQIYAAQLREQTNRIEAARAAQQTQAAQLEQQAQQLRQLQQQQQQRLNRQSAQNRREQATYAAHLEQQAQQLRAEQQAQAVYRARLDQQAAQLRAAQQAQNQQQQQLRQQEEMLRQAMLQQQAATNPYPFDNSRQVEEPLTIPQGAGVSGYRQTTSFVPGKERTSVDYNETIQPLSSASQGFVNIPNGAGVSGSHYHEELPPIQTDYASTYGVPQPQITRMPAGVGVSGWVDPNPQTSQAQPAHTDFFGFMNSDAPAGVRSSNTEIITPGSGDEFIATTGPDGEVTVTIKSK